MFILVFKIFREIFLVAFEFVHNFFNGQFNIGLI